MSATKPAFSHASNLTPDTSPLTTSDTSDASAGSPPSLATSNGHDATAAPAPDAIQESSSGNLASANALVAAVAAMRDEACERARPLVSAGAAPIRVMASMVAQLEAACRERGIPEQVIAS